MTKHKHAELIKAWADGAQVQIKMQNGVWLDIDRHHWNVDCEFRIKPAEKVVRWLWIFEDNGIWSVTHSYLTESEFLCLVKFRCPYRKLEWSREEFDE